MCRYTWLHNDVALNMNVENIRPAVDGSGSIVIQPATALNEGSYQCRAETQYGTALSNISILHKAVLRTNVRTVSNLTVGAGEPFHIPVVPLRCFPPPSFTWVTAKVIDKDETTGSSVVTTDRRIQVSDNGKYIRSSPMSSVAQSVLSRNCNFSCTV